jgi:hypothetical protein
MNPIKLFGLSTAAALAAIAFAGATSASAATLCLANESPCSKSNNKELILLLSKIEFLTTFVTMKCHTDLHMTVLMGDEGGVDVTPLSFSECEGCIEPSATASSAEAVATKGGNGEVIMTLQLTLKGCPFGAECEYVAKSAKLPFDGSATAAKLLATNVEFKKTGGSALCSLTGKLNGTFEGVSEKDKMSFLE